MDEEDNNITFTPDGVDTPSETMNAVVSAAVSLDDIQDRKARALVLCGMDYLVQRLKPPAQHSKPAEVLSFRTRPL